MEWLNYHHLFYFWKVVRTGSITRACEELRLAPPTISAQLRSLEEQMGEKLLTRSGRSLVPTEMGRVVFRYAEDIFGLGQELMDAVKQRPTGRPLRVVIGVDDVLPKEIAHALIEPALRLPEGIRLLCREASLERLVADLALHELDVVLSDAPIAPSLNFRAYNHPLGECEVVWVGTADLARKYRRGFPKSLDGAPVLLPTDDTAIRRGLDQWFAALGIRPVVVGEFEDYALLRVFGQKGAGVYPAPRILEKDLKRHHGLAPIGLAKDVRGRFYAISVEKKVRHPAVAAICEAARRTLFSQ
jgi:LysR family transcriptional regulator, transcriptional activator of nhaA